MTEIYLDNKFVDLDEYKSELERRYKLATTINNFKLLKYLKTIKEPISGSEINKKLNISKGINSILRKLFLAGNIAKFQLPNKKTYLYCLTRQGFDELEKVENDSELKKWVSNGGFQA